MTLCLMIKILTNIMDSFSIIRCCYVIYVWSMLNVHSVQWRRRRRRKIQREIFKMGLITCSVFLFYFFWKSCFFFFFSNHCRKSHLLFARFLLLLLLFCFLFYSTFFFFLLSSNSRRFTNCTTHLHTIFWFSQTEISTIKMKMYQKGATSSE